MLLNFALIDLDLIVSWWSVNIRDLYILKNLEYILKKYILKNFVLLNRVDSGEQMQRLKYNDVG